MFFLFNDDVVRVALLVIDCRFRLLRLYTFPLWHQYIRHQDRPLHYFTVHIVIIIFHHRQYQLLLVRIDLVGDLALSHQQVFLDVFERLKSQVHVDGWDTLAPIFLRMKYQVLLDFQLVNGLPSFFTCSVFDALSFDFKSDSDEARI